MEKNYKKIIALMKERETETLIIERKYLPEFIDYSLVIIKNTLDGFPLLEHNFEIFLIERGIIIEYKHLLIHFIKKSKISIPKNWFDYKIENIVAIILIKTDKNIDLNQIARNSSEIVYNPERFHGLIMRVEKSRSTIMIFSTGKIIITGLRKPSEAKVVMDKVLKNIKKKGIKFLNPEIEIQNIVASCDFHTKIDLNKASIVLEYAMYEPEVFQGLIYRMQEPEVVFIIFPSGRVVCTGTKEKKHLKEGILNLYKQIRTLGLYKNDYYFFKKNDNDEF